MMSDGRWPLSCACQPPHASNARQENPLRPSRSPYLDMLQACSGGVLQCLLLVLSPPTFLHRPWRRKPEHKALRESKSASSERQALKRINRAYKLQRKATEKGSMHHLQHKLKGKSARIRLAC